jgi:hypothetical protein
MTDAPQAVMGAGREPMNARPCGPSPREAARSKDPSASPIRTAPSGVLSGPIAPVMLRLALPTIVVLVVQTLVGVAETYFISFLGTEALAGVTLVFPVLMLVQMMSNGGIGGGVASVTMRRRPQMLCRQKANASASRGVAMLEVRRRHRVEVLGDEGPGMVGAWAAHEVLEPELVEKAASRQIAPEHIEVLLVAAQQRILPADALALHRMLRQWR